MNITACWLVKDEARELERSILSVRNAVDGLLVVSTAQNGEVSRVAEQYNATLQPYTWRDNFSHARNFALEQVAKGLVLFLDADEYFETALGKAQRAGLEAAFVKGGAQALAFERKNYDSDTGAYIQSSVDIRMFNSEMRYKGVIHERLTAPGGAPPRVQLFEGLKLVHTGYGVQLSKEKFKRNYNILIKAVKEGEDGTEALLHLCYLLRECYALGKFGEAAEYVRRLAADRAGMGLIFSQFADIGRQAVFYALLIAEEQGDEGLNRLVMDVLARGFAKTADEDSAGLFALACRQKLYPDDTWLLESLPRLAAFRPDADKDIFFSLLLDLYSAAGQAALRLGKAGLAFSCAYKAFTRSESVQNEADFNCCLKALGGQPVEQIIAALSQGLNLNSKPTLERLVDYSQLPGYEKLYLFYTLTAFERRLLASIDYCYFLIYSKKYREAAAYAEKTIKDVGHRQCMLLLAAVCGGGEQLFAAHHHSMGEYAAPAKAFLRGEALSKAESERIGIPSYCYKKIAFAAGFEAADRFLALYEKAGSDKTRLLCFDIRLACYAKCGRYAEFFGVNTYTPTEQDSKSRLALAEMAVLAKDVERAQELLEKLAQSGQKPCQTANLLAALAAGAPARVAAAAEELARQLRAATASPAL